ncbi:PrnB family protein [Ilumatobacter nonamiensis]|uniref:PrnB family protein n=1 Tax=Ilumatobacter nonamiensis TaxID=467093 RepID=UPI00068425A5|nr:monodechloroaminopyrrolnitrin synthase PrnB family protein [Ilumatobacter nonamiensis]
MIEAQPHSATTPRVAAFDTWIRGRFIELNTELEAVYATQENRANVAGVGDELKTALHDEGRALIIPLIEEGNTDEGFDRAFELLGNVGYYMAACRRHEITEPSRERSSPLVEASTLALHLGASVGTAPRFVTSHMETYNRAVNGMYRTFTAGPAEKTFIDYNTRSAFAYMRAADALGRIHPMGISHPAAHDLLVAARDALADALRLNTELGEILDVDDFFFSVRPYYKPYRVGSQEYRGANAGDFAAFNQIDLLLGLCSPTDPSYTQIVVEKIPYLTPDEQRQLHHAFRHPNLLDSLLGQSESRDEPWFQENAATFLEVCEMHGSVAAHHHDELVARFIQHPAERIPPEHLEGLTASGPPLDVLLHALEALRDRRLAADRDDIPTRRDDLATLRSMLRNR